MASDIEYENLTNANETVRNAEIVKIKNQVNTLDEKATRFLRELEGKAKKNKENRISSFLLTPLVFSLFPIWGKSIFSVLSIDFFYRLRPFLTKSNLLLTCYNITVGVRIVVGLTYILHQM